MLSFEIEPDRPSLVSEDGSEESVLDLSSLFEFYLFEFSCELWIFFAPNVKSVSRYSYLVADNADDSHRLSHELKKICLVSPDSSRDGGDVCCLIFETLADCDSCVD